MGSPEDDPHGSYRRVRRRAALEYGRVRQRQLLRRRYDAFRERAPWRWLPGWVRRVAFLVSGHVVDVPEADELADRVSDRRRRAREARATSVPDDALEVARG